MKDISIRKGRQIFCIRYEVGEESIVLDQLVAMVHQDIGFDWFDAAVLSHQTPSRPTNGGNSAAGAGGWRPRRTSIP